MIKLELEFNNIQAFDDFVSAFNNAMIAYHDIVWSAKLGCAIPSKWESLIQSKGETELQRRLDILTHVYSQTEKYLEELKEAEK